MAVKSKKHPTLEGILSDVEGIKPHLKKEPHIYVSDRKSVV